MASRTRSAATDIADNTLSAVSTEFEALMLVPGKLTLPTAAAELFKDTHWVTVVVEQGQVILRPSYLSDAARARVEALELPAGDD
jgi:hypothetical protein